MKRILLPTLLVSVLSASAAQAQDESVLDRLSTEAPITVNFKEQDLATILEVFSQQYQLNLIYGPEVQGTVSLNLHEAQVGIVLKQILAANGYALIESDGLLLVVPVDQAGELGDAAEEELPAVVYEPRVLYLSHLRAEDVEPFIAGMLAAGEAVIAGPSSGQGISDLEGDVGGNQQASQEMLLLLAGPDTQARVDALLVEIDVAPKQVLVEATILAVTLTDEFEMGVDFSSFGGINFQALGSTSSITDGVQTGSASGNDFNNWLVGGSQRGFTDGGADGLHLGILRNQTGVFIQALEQVGNATVLSNPSVLAVNRHAAQVLVGQKIGYITSTTTETATQQTVNFLEVGTSLSFRPFIGNDGTIRMEVHPESSDGAINPATGLPDEATTELTANVVVRTGETIVLGGLMENTLITDTRQVPFLGDLPVVGWLFRNEATTNVRREIIVLLTPHIVDQADLRRRGSVAQRRMAAARAQLAASHPGYLRPSVARRMYREAGEALALGDSRTALAKAEWGLAAMPADPDLAALAEHCRIELRESGAEQLEMLDAIELIESLQGTEE